jgi:hypothetical protein
MLKKNRNAQLQGAMALVASATAELQRLKPHPLGAANVMTKATTHKDSADLIRTQKPFTAGAALKSGYERSKLVPFVAKGTTHKDSPELTGTRDAFSARVLTAGLKNRSEQSKLIRSAAKAAPNLRQMRHG